MESLANNLLEVKLLMDAAVVEETLSRMGIADTKNKILYQSCHLLKHFRQLLHRTLQAIVRVRTWEGRLPRIRKREHGRHSEKEFNRLLSTEMGDGGDCGAFED